MIRSFKLTNLIRLTMTNHKIPRPRDPTVAQSFDTILSDQQMKILLDPKGFMSEQEKIR